MADDVIRIIITSKYNFWITQILSCKKCWNLNIIMYMHIVIITPSFKKIRARKIDILTIYTKNYEIMEFWWRHLKIFKKIQDPKLNLEIWNHKSKIWILKNNILKKKKNQMLEFCALTSRKSIEFTIEFCIDEQRVGVGKNINFQNFWSIFLKNLDFVL